MQAPLQQQGGDPWRGMFLDTYSSFFFYLQSIFFFLIEKPVLVNKLSSR